MRDDIKTTWIIAALLVGIMGVSSLFSENISAQSNQEFSTASVAMEKQIAQKSIKQQGFCDWVGNLFTSS